MAEQKVLNVITDLNIGGAGKVLENFYSHCDYGKFDHMVVVPAGSRLVDAFKEKKAKTIAFEGLEAKSFSARSIWPLFKLFRKTRPDIVHAHGCLSARIAASMIKGIKVVYTRHCVYEPTGFFKSPFGRLTGRVVFSLFADRAIAVSPASMKNMTATGVPEKHIDVMMNGSEPLDEMSEDEISVARKELGIGQRDFVFAMVGRLEEIKGHRYFIKAAVSIKEKCPDTKFMIVGEGSIREDLEKAAGMEGHIIFTGFMKDVSMAVNSSDVLVNASYGTEASSLAIIEAMSLGKPVIATDYGGNPYQVEDGKTGIVVPVKDERALASAMVDLCTDEGLYSEMSKNSKRAYDEKYTAAIMTKNIEKIYESLVKGNV